MKRGKIERTRIESKKEMKEWEKRPEKRQMLDHMSPPVGQMNLLEY